MTEARDNKGNVKCFTCGGWTYVHDGNGQKRCPSCNGTGISQKPTRQSRNEDLEL
jgi:hypothetical protein